MPDTTLRDLVLKRLDADTQPEDEWSAVVLAAKGDAGGCGLCGGPSWDGGPPSQPKGLGMTDVLLRLPPVVPVRNRDTQFA